MTDSQIISDIRKGKNRAAIKHLYMLYPMVFKLASQYHLPKEEIEDIFQESLLILYKKIHNSQSLFSSALSTFLYAVARNLIRERVRKPKPEMNKLIDETEAVNWEEIQEREKQYIRMEHAIEQIGSRCKEILSRFYVKRENMKSIAKAMSFNNELTAKNMKYKCLQKARKIVKAEE